MEGARISRGTACDKTPYMDRRQHPTPIRPAQSRLGFASLSSRLLPPRKRYQRAAPRRRPGSRDPPEYPSGTKKEPHPKSLLPRKTSMLACASHASAERSFSTKKGVLARDSALRNCRTIVAKQCAAEFGSRPDELSQSCEDHGQKRCVSSGNQEQRNHLTEWFAIDSLSSICHPRRELPACLRIPPPSPKGQRKCRKPTRYPTKNCCA
jgi:hypothetical protein